MKLDVAQKDHDELKQQLARASADEPRETTSERSSSRRRADRSAPSIALR
jgi:hypothetical protein